MLKYLFFVFLGLLVASCNQLKPEKNEVAPLATSKPMAMKGHVNPQHGKIETTLSKEDAGLVVATIGDKEITLGELERQLHEQPVYVRVRYNSLDKKKEFLDNVIRFELLALEAVKRGYDKDPAVVFSMKQQMIKMLMAQDLESLVSMKDVTDESIAAFYEKNKSVYFKPAACRISEIVLKNKDKADTLLARLQTEFKESPRRRRQTFTKTVDADTMDPIGKAKRGDSGFFTLDGLNPETLEPLDSKMSPEVRAAAFKIEKINGLSPVVTVGDTHSILLLTNRRPEVSKSLEAVKRQIRNTLFRNAKDEARDAYIANLRKEANVVIHQEKLALLKDEKAQPKIPGRAEIQRLRTDVEVKGLIPGKREPESKGATP